MTSPLLPTFSYILKKYFQDSDKIYPVLFPHLYSFEYKLRALTPLLVSVLYKGQEKILSGMRKLTFL